MAPVLIALLVWAARRGTRLAWVDLGALTVLFGFVGIVRLTLATELVRQPISRYGVQRWLFGTVGGLVVPWHVDVTMATPWLAPAVALLVLAVAVAFVVGPLIAARTRVAAATALWVFIASLPTMTFFFVGPDLQGSRYLYLPAVGWALLVTTMSRSLGAIGPLILVALGLSGSVGVRWHQRPWADAAAARDTVLSAVREPQLQSCAAVAVDDLPDAVRGAYVFRNGAREAFAQGGVTLIDQAGPECTVISRPAQQR